MKSDLISRQATIDLITTGAVALTIDENDDALDVMEKTVTQMKKWMVECIADLPSAQPERKKGKWVRYDGDWLKTMCKCSECGAMIDINEKYRNLFCYHCGARMDGEQV